MRTFLVESKVGARTALFDFYTRDKNASLLYPGARVTSEPLAQQYQVHFAWVHLKLLLQGNLRFGEIKD